MEPKHKTGLALAVAVLIVLPMTLLSKFRHVSFDSGSVSSDAGAGLRIFALVAVSVVIFVVVQKMKK